MSPDQRFEDSHRNGQRTLRGREGVKLGPLLPQGRVVDGDQGSGDHGQEADEAGFMACAPIVFHLDIDNVHSWENIGFEDPVAMEQEIEAEQPAIAFASQHQGHLQDFDELLQLSGNDGAGDVELGVVVESQP